LVRVYKLPSAEEAWKMITLEYMRKGVFARADLRKRFMELLCPRDDNVRLFLVDLATKREELAAGGVEINNADYRSTILSAVPPYLKSYAASVQASASVKEPTYEIDPTILIHMISEEYDRVAREKEKAKASKTFQKLPKKAEGDVALATSSTPQSVKPQSPQRRIGICWNCGQQGHRQWNCQKPSKSPGEPGYLPFAPKTPPKAPKASVASAPSVNPGGSTAAVQEEVPPDEDIGDGVWAVYEDIQESRIETRVNSPHVGDLAPDDEYADMPELTDGSEEDAEEFDVMIDEETILRACFDDDDILDLPCNQNLPQKVEQITDESMEAHVDEEEAAVNVEEDVSAATERIKGVSPVCAELYDSG
jgi:hypothetical protein